MMNERPDGLIERLETLGAAEPTPLSSARVAEIEHELLTRIERHGERSRRWLAPTLAAAVIGILIAGAALVPRSDPRPVVGSTIGSVELQLPDGTSVAATVGDELVDGTTIIVDSDELIVIDGVELGPGRWTIVDGRPAARAEPDSPTSPVPPLGAATDTTSRLPAAVGDTIGADDARSSAAAQANRSSTTVAEPMRPPQSTRVRAADPVGESDDGVASSVVDRAASTTEPTRRTTTTTTTARASSTTIAPSTSTVRPSSAPSTRPIGAFPPATSTVTSTRPPAAAESTAPPSTR